MRGRESKVEMETRGRNANEMETRERNAYERSSLGEIETRGGTYNVR